jgi:hypothetical protein
MTVYVFGLQGNLEKFICFFEFVLRLLFDKR